MTRKRDPYLPLRELLCGKVCGRYQKLDYEAWAADTGLSRTTLWRRMRDPQHFQVVELRTIADALGIPLEEVGLTAFRR